MVGDPMTILVAEDNADCRDLYSIWLGDDHTVELVANGTAALEAVGPPVDIVFLDRDMPGHTGTEVAHELADMPYNLYVVMVSSRDPDFDIVEMPIGRYVQKPVDQPTLESIIEQCRTQSGYCDALGDFFVLAVKLASIEAETPEEALTESDEYERLCERVTRKRADVNSALAPDQVDWSLAFKTCPAPGDGQVGNPNA